jgi:exosortase
MSVALETPRAAPDSIWLEIRRYWDVLPNKGFFLVLLAAWCALFQFWGTTQFNFSTTPSLFQWMYGAWDAPAMDSEHGKLIPWVVLGLLWYKRDQLAACKPGPGWLALPLLALALLLHVAGFLVQQPRLSMMALFLGLYSLVGVVWGWGAMKATFFPLVLFGFCLPLGTVLDPYTLSLRILASKATLFICKDLLNIPVVRDGTLLKNPDGSSFEVAAACSGIRSFVALSCITTIFAVLKFKKAWKRALIILLTIPLALGCNTIRLVAIIVAQRASGAAAANLIHEWFGYVTYALALLCLILADSLLKEPEEETPPPPIVSTAYDAL